MIPEPGLIIKRLLIHETGTYENQWRRPFETTLDGHTLSALQQRLDPNAPYRPSMLAGIAGNFIRPMAQPEGHIAIANGWDVPRARFMMIVEYRYATGNVSEEIILGYTDHVGISHTGAIDPQMRFYANGTSKVRTIAERTPHGIMHHRTATDSAHVLVDNNWSGISTPERGHQMRPEDVFAVMSRSHVPDMNKVFDTRTALTDRPSLSRRINSSPANYVASILESHKNASRIGEYGQGMAEIFSEARGAVQEPLSMNNRFLSAISQVQNGGAMSSNFTFSALRQLDPDVDNKTVAVLLAPTQKATVHQAGLASSWQGADVQTQVATMLSQSVPGLLMDLLLTRVVFRATNQLPGAQIEVLISDVDGFADQDHTPSVMAFIDKMRLHILRDISYDNMIAFDITMHVDLLGETTLDMVFDESPHVRYVTPSFCDALLSPVVTYNPQLTTTMAHDFETLLSGLADPGVPGYQGSTGNMFGNL